jgi:hypothetical protein
VAAYARCFLPWSLESVLRTAAACSLVLAAFSCYKRAGVSA